MGGMYCLGWWVVLPGCEARTAWCVGLCTVAVCVPLRTTRSDADSASYVIPKP